MSAPGRRRYRTILYSRSLVPGLNDSDEHLARAYALGPAGRCHGLYRLVLPGSDRALLPGQRAARTLRRHRAPEDRARGTRDSECWQPSQVQPLAVPQDLVRLSPTRTACPITTVITASGKLCGICPAGQVSPCRSAPPGTFGGPNSPDGPRVAGNAGHTGSRHQQAGQPSSSRLGDEQPRCYLQHALGFQMHDVRHPHAAAPHAGVCHVAGADAISRYDLGLLIAWRNGLDPARAPRPGAPHRPPGRDGRAAGQHQDPGTPRPPRGLEKHAELLTPAP